MSGILSATFDHYCWLLRPVLNLHVYLPFLRTGAIVNGDMPLSKWILSPSFDHYHWLIWLALIFIETYDITSNARYCQLVNTIMLINALAILRGTFGNFRPLSLTTSTCVNLHRDLYHYLERALSPTCEHYNVNEHPRNPSGYFR